jgi:hypothetical protein
MLRSEIFIKPAQLQAKDFRRRFKRNLLQRGRNIGMRLRQRARHALSDFLERHTALAKL